MKKRTVEVEINLRDFAIKDFDELKIRAWESLSRDLRGNYIVPKLELYNWGRGIYRCIAEIMGEDLPNFKIKIRHAIIISALKMRDKDGGVDVALIDGYNAVGSHAHHIIEDLCFENNGAYWFIDAKFSKSYNFDKALSDLIENWEARFMRQNGVVSVKFCSGGSGAFVVAEVRKLPPDYHIAKKATESLIALIDAGLELEKERE